MEPAAGPSGIMRNEVVDDDAAAGEVGDALRNAEVDSAHGVRISQGRARERTCPQYELDAIATATHDRIEALARHRVGNLLDRIGIEASEMLAPYAAPPDLDRSVAGAGHVREEKAQSLIRSGDTPPAIDCRRHAVDQARPSATADCGRGVFFDEFRFDEFGEVLTYRVVIEPKVRGEFGDVDGLVGVRDVAEDVVARGIAQSARLFLKRSCHVCADAPIADVRGNCESAASRRRNTLVLS